jgi:hypothetical protein
MTSTTFEDAKRCPKCETPGMVISKRMSLHSSPVARAKPTVYVIRCVNQLCAWFDTNWIVQVNPDGSIPAEGYSKTEDKRFK